MTSYSYQNYKGYRQHSQEYQHRLNSLLEVDFTPQSKLSVYGFYVNGLIKLPGSDSLSKYIVNDTSANTRSLNRVCRRRSSDVAVNNATRMSSFSISARICPFVTLSPTAIFKARTRPTAPKANSATCSACTVPDVTAETVDSTVPR